VTALPGPYPQGPARPEAGIHPAVCSWCHEQYRAGNPDLPVTHGICGPCAEIWQRGVGQ
jgi:hypothetical protein